MEQDKIKDLYNYDEQYRDTIATVDEKGKRVWIYPKKPKGRYHNKRIVVSIVLLAILFAGPFIKIGGEPFLLLNIFERKFCILTSRLFHLGPYGHQLFRVHHSFYRSVR